MPIALFVISLSILFSLIAITARALELFVESLVTKTSLITKSRNAKTLTASHLYVIILRYV